jgi:Flp pilus assembly protein TadG
MTLRDAERGSMTVEFALVFPLVCLTVSALLQTGLAVRSRILVSQAAREGARQATTTNSSGEIRRAATQGAGGLNGEGLEVTCSAPEGWQSGHPVTVIVSYNMPCVFPGLAVAWPDSLRIAESATMRLEKDPS